MLVWKGKIIEKLDTECPHGDFLCEFGCVEVLPFRVRVCAQLFVKRDGNDVEIPMEFKCNGKVYNPAEENTPLSNLQKEIEKDMKGFCETGIELGVAIINGKKNKS